MWLIVDTTAAKMATLKLVKRKNVDLFILFITYVHIHSITIVSLVFNSPPSECQREEFSCLERRIQPTDSGKNNSSEHGGNKTLLTKHVVVDFIWDVIHILGWFADAGGGHQQQEPQVQLI